MDVLKEDIWPSLHDRLINGRLHSLIAQRLYDIHYICMAYRILFCKRKQLIRTALINTKT